MYYHQPKITDISTLNSSLEDVNTSLTNATSLKQITDDNAFSNKFGVFSDWTGWFRSKSSSMPKYLTIIRLPSADSHYTTFIAVSCETSTFGNMYIGFIDTSSKSVSLKKTLG